MPKKLTYNEKRKATYAKLIDLGFDTKFARANRNNFRLVSDNRKIKAAKLKIFKKARKKQINKIVKDYYQDSLGFTAAKANAKRSNRLQVWKETLIYLRRHEIRLENRPSDMPKIPGILHSNGVKLLSNTFHYLHPKEDPIALYDQIEAMDEEKILRHQYRLERFIVTQDEGVIEKFVQTLNEQSDLDDYYTMMDESYKAPSKPDSNFKDV